MDIQKLIEMELKKILKEEEEVKDIQTKQSGVLKRSPQQPSDEKVVNIQTKQSGVLKRSTLEEEDKVVQATSTGAGTLKKPKIKIGTTFPLDGSEQSRAFGIEQGYLIKKEDGIGANKAAGWVYVDPDSKTDFSVKYVGTPEEQKAAKAAISNKKRARPEVKELQALMNKWLASKLNPSPYAFRGMRGSKRSNVNEDGFWGPKSQEGLDHIRSLDKSVPPEGSGIPKILQYFKSIEAQMVPLAPATAPAQPAAAPATPAVTPGPAVGASTGRLMSGSGRSSEDPLVFPTSLAAEVWAEQQANKRNDQSGEQSLYIKTQGGRSGILTFTGKKYEITEMPKNPLEESKKLRAMVLQEILKTLK